MFHLELGIRQHTPRSLSHSSKMSKHKSKKAKLELKPVPPAPRRCKQKPEGDWCLHDYREEKEDKWVNLWIPGRPGECPLCLSCFAVFQARHEAAHQLEAEKRRIRERVEEEIRALEEKHKKTEDLRSQQLRDLVEEWKKK